jgi:hypothetical protein
MVLSSGKILLNSWLSSIESVPELAKELVPLDLLTRESVREFWDRRETKRTVLDLSMISDKLVCSMVVSTSEGVSSAFFLENARWLWTGFR